MIKSAREFARLRQSLDPAEQTRATQEAAESDQVWQDVVTQFPELKVWVVRNKKVSLDILRRLSTDPDPRIRREVASKRKLDADLIAALEKDPDPNVRQQLAQTLGMRKRDHD
jgi:hypothetical protein